MRANVVVVGQEFVDLLLQFGGGGCRGQGPQVLLERLVEAFDLAAGLRMVGAAQQALDEWVPGSVH